jgi:sulfatase maturation enzyme AslB (radical SAM superfamily)/tetratricopeptide (TPR) repeat protein
LSGAGERHSSPKLFCVVPFTRAAVMPNGDVYPGCCPDWLEFPFGNVLKRSWEEVWNGERARQFRRSAFDGSLRHCRADWCPSMQDVEKGLPSDDVFRQENLERLYELPHGREWKPVFEQAQEVLPRGPRQVDLNYDYSCTLKCPSCRLDFVQARGEELEEVRRVHEIATREIMRDARKIMITGSGDPFGSRVFRGFLESFRPEQYPQLQSIALQTNAQLWTERAWQRMPGVQQLPEVTCGISIDAATPETYHYVRQPGRWDKLIENLRFICTIPKLRHINLHFVVQESNFREMPAFVQLAEQVRAWSGDGRSVRIFFQKMRNWGHLAEGEYERMQPADVCHPLYREFRRVLLQVEDLQQEYARRGGCPQITHNLDTAAFFSEFYHDPRLWTSQAAVWALERSRMPCRQLAGPLPAEDAPSGVALPPPVLLQGLAVIDAPFAILRSVAASTGEGGERLLPEDPREAAAVDAWLELLHPVTALQPLLRRFEAGPALAALQFALDRLEQVLDETPWSAGQSFSLSDLTWAALLAHLGLAGLASSCRLAERRRVAAYAERLEARGLGFPRTGEATGLQALFERSDVFCMAPWTHQHVPVQEGTVRLCCDAPDLALGSIKQGDTLGSAWNSEAMRSVRLAMLNGKPVPGCQRCYDNQRLGRSSYRHWFNQHFAHRFEAVAETGADGWLDPKQLRFLDIRFSNLGNMSCRICSVEYSTNWHRDSVALGLAPRHTPALSLAADEERLWPQIEALLPQIEQIHFAGGEPLLMEQHYRILEHLVELGHLDVQLRYNTNFSRLTFRGWDVVELWKRFSRVRIEASLDGSGSRGDYMRKGQVWREIVANRERLLRECPHVEFFVHATVSIMNVLHLPDFYREWVDLGFLDPHNMDPHALRHPAHLNMQGLPSDLKRSAEAKYRSLVEDYLPRLGVVDPELAGRFTALVRFLWSDQPRTVLEFRYETQKLGALRGESFAEVFPELAELMSPHPALPRWDAACAALLRGDGAAESLLEDLLSALTDELTRSPALVLVQRRRAEGDLGGLLAGLARQIGEPDRARDRFVEHWRELSLAGERAGALAALTHALRCRAYTVNQILNQPSEGVDGARRRREWLRTLLGANADVFAEPAFGPYARGVARCELGEHLDARQDFAEACALGGPPELQAACANLAATVGGLEIAPAGPRTGEEHLERGRSRLADGDLRGAIADLDQALRLAPHLPSLVSKILRERGRARRAAGDLRGSFEDIDRAIELGSLASMPMAQMLIERAELRRMLGDPSGELRDRQESFRLRAKGFEEPETAVRSVPRAGSVVLERARSRCQTGEFAAALADYEEALATVAGLERSLILGERARIRQVLGDEDGMLQDLAAAVALAPESALANLDQTLAALAAGHELPEFMSGFGSLPAAAVLHCLRGTARGELGDREGALQDFGVALEIAARPDSPLHRLVERLRRGEWDPLRAAFPPQSS